MRPRSAPPALVVVLLAFALLVSPAWAGGSSNTPYQLDGTYDSTADTFNLTWQYSGPSVDHFVVYIDGEAVEPDEPITTTNFVDDLAEWRLALPPTVVGVSDVELTRYYQVAAVVDGVEGDLSETLAIKQVRLPGGSCGIIGITGPYPVDEWLPVFGHAIYEECLPPIPPL